MRRFAKRANFEAHWPRWIEHTRAQPTCTLLRETRLRATTGRHPENPTLDVPCREVFSRGQKPIRVWGPSPTIEDELAAVHARFWLGR